MLLIYTVSTPDVQIGYHLENTGFMRKKIQCKVLYEISLLVSMKGKGMGTNSQVFQKAKQAQAGIIKPPARHSLKKNAGIFLQAVWLKLHTNFLFRKKVYCHSPCTRGSASFKDFHAILLYYIQVDKLR